MELKLFSEKFIQPDFWDSVKQGEELYPAYREFMIKNSTTIFTKFLFMFAVLNF